MFRKRFEEDTNNKYVFVLSNLHFEDTNNIKYFNCKWVKKSIFHRLWFDNIYIKKILESEKPDKIISLQNKAVAGGKIFQEVYFHNVLLICERQYRFSESKKLWLYQHPIAFLTKISLKKANKIIVQAEWIKEELSTKWNISSSRIEVQRPSITLDVEKMEMLQIKGCPLFYPAPTAIYKNHITLIKACVNIWNEFGKNCGLTLSLTCNINDLSRECLDIIKADDYPISFLGRLSKDQLLDMYSKTILVFPSVLETVGLPLIEAAQFDSKIIVSDLKYSHEALKDYENVTYFEPENVQALSETIRKIL